MRRPRTPHRGRGRQLRPERSRVLACESRLSQPWCRPGARASRELPRPLPPAHRSLRPPPREQLLCPRVGAPSFGAVARRAQSGERPAKLPGKSRQGCLRQAAPQHSELLPAQPLQALASPPQQPDVRTRRPLRQRLPRPCGGGPLQGPRRGRRPPPWQRRLRSRARTSERGLGGEGPRA